MLDYFLEIENLKKTKRYGEYDKAFAESVPDHSFFVCLLGIELMAKYNINLDFERVTKMALLHDLPELGLENDFDAVLASVNKDVEKSKQEHELKTIWRLSEDYNKPELMELHTEYKEQKTREARFVKALDRLETTIHIINTDNVRIKDEEFTAKYCLAPIKNFPELKPFYKEVQKKLKQRFTKDGHSWQIGWDV